MEVDKRSARREITRLIGKYELVYSRLSSTRETTGKVVPQVLYLDTDMFGGALIEEACVYNGRTYILLDNGLEHILYETFGQKIDYFVNPMECKIMEPIPGNL